MMQLSQAAKVLDGQMVGSDVQFAAVSSDSRKLMHGDLFIALRGEHFDGFEFIAQAAGNGAAAAMVNSKKIEAQQSTSGKTQFGEGIPLLVVKDTRLALGQLAAYWRKQFKIPLVAITGSNGKTTVKEMLSSILREAAGNEAAVLSTTGNLNNDIGMPLTLLKMGRQHRYAVVEMGMNHPGEIDYLSRIACPDMALVNNASTAHLEGLGSVEAVARAKGEIFSGLRPNGMAIINADDQSAPLWRTLVGAHPMLEFGLNQQADVSGMWHQKGFGLRIEVQTPQGNFTADLQVPGEHNACNALAATAAAIGLNIPLETIVAGLERFGGVAGRMQRKSARHGAALIDDTYNANPASLSAAIDVLSRTKGKKILVLGDMGELGEKAAFFHARMGKEARDAGIDELFTLGELSANTTREFGSGACHFESVGDLEKVLEKELDVNTTVLVKGSRFMKMERVVKFLEAGEISDPRRMQEEPCS